MDAQERHAAALARTIDSLSDTTAMSGLYSQGGSGGPFPSAPAVEEIIGLCRAVLFPGFYGKGAAGGVLRHRVGVDVDRLFSLLAGQVEACLRFDGRDGLAANQACPLRREAEDRAAAFMERLPAVRETLSTDVEAAYKGDPAAESYGEVVCCYPAIRALTCYRVAHQLHLLRVPLLPRIITETAHSETGIDIHPGARIGRHFTIDHGTGVVIGATCVIGDRVKLYQGVTLGARNFPLDESGNPVKRIPRHPVLEDDVVVYSNATILGRIVIGRGAVVGGNVWLTHDVASGTMVRQAQAPTREACDIDAD